MDTHSLCNHHLLYQRKHLGIGHHVGTQHHITLLQHPIITDERVKILAVVLRNDHIHKTATFFTATCNEHIVGRRDHYKRDRSDMIRKTIITFFVAFELLLIASLQTTRNLFIYSAVGHVIALNHKEWLFMEYIL